MSGSVTQADGLRFARDLMITAVCAFILICGPVTCTNIDSIADSLRGMEAGQ